VPTPGDSQQHKRKEFVRCWGEKSQVVERGGVKTREGGSTYDRKASEKKGGNKEIGEGRLRKKAR